MTSYDDILNRQLDQMRRKLVRELTELCQLSSTGTAHGYVAINTKGKAIGRLASARLEENTLYIDTLAGQKESLLATEVSRRHLLHFRKLKWVSSKPYHPLEALAEVENYFDPTGGS